MIPTKVDSSLYIKNDRVENEGLLGAYVDYCLLASTKKFQEWTKKTANNSDSRPREWNNVKFHGVQIFTKMIDHEGMQRRFFYWKTSICLKDDQTST